MGGNVRSGHAGALGVVLFWAALLGLAAAPGAAAPWDPRDVAAAESYREAERERADRYRAKIARTPRSDAPSTPAARTPDDHGRAEAAPGWLERAFEALRSTKPEPERPKATRGVLSRALDALLAEFDRDAIVGAWERAREGWRWWEHEGRPRAVRIWDFVSGELGTEAR